METITRTVSRQQTWHTNTAGHHRATRAAQLNHHHGPMEDWTAKAGLTWQSTTATTSWVWRPTLAVSTWHTWNSACLNWKGCWSSMKSTSPNAWVLRRRDIQPDTWWSSRIHCAVFYGKVRGRQVKGRCSHLPHSRRDCSQAVRLLHTRNGHSA